MARLNDKIRYHLKEWKALTDTYDEFKPLVISVNKCAVGSDTYHVDLQNTTDNYTKSKERAYFMNETQLKHYIQGMIDILDMLTIYDDYFKPNYLKK